MSGRRVRKLTPEKIAAIDAIAARYGRLVPQTPERTSIFECPTDLSDARFEEIYRDGSIFDVLRAFDIYHPSTMCISRVIILAIMENRVLYVCEILHRNDIPYLDDYSRMGIVCEQMDMFYNLKTSVGLDVSRVVDIALEMGECKFAATLGELRELVEKDQEMPRPEHVAGCISIANLVSDTYLESVPIQGASSVPLPKDIVGYVERYLLNGDLHLIDTLVCGTILRMATGVTGVKIANVDIDLAKSRIKAKFIRLFGASLRMADVLEHIKLTANGGHFLDVVIRFAANVTLMFSKRVKPREALCGAVINLFRAIASDEVVDEIIERCQELDYEVCDACGCPCTDGGCGCGSSEDGEASSSDGDPEVEDSDDDDEESDSDDDEYS